MAGSTLTYTSYTYYDPTVVETSKNCVTTIRDGQTKKTTEKGGYIPKTSHDEKTPGVGGTGGASTTIPGGTAYHNISYLSMPKLSTTIPKGAKISSASATFGIKRADANNTNACIWSICPCNTFTNSITGKSKPTAYTSQACSTNVDAVSKPDTSQTATINATSCIQYMVRNSLNCIQIYTSKDANRRYMQPATGNNNYIKISINYNSTPTFSSKSIKTDCVDADENDSTYVQKTISMSADGDGSYYRYSYATSDGKYKNSTDWVKVKSYDMPIDTKIPEGTKITAKIESIFFNDWYTDNSIVKYEVTNLIKNYSPSASITGMPTKSNTNNPSNAYYIDDTHCIATGKINIAIENIKMYGIKRGYKGNKPYAKLIEFNSKTSESSTDRTNSKLSTQISLPDEAKNNTVKCSISNGWNTWSSSYTIKSAAPLSWEKSGALSNDKVLCNVEDRKFISKVTQSKELPSPTHEVDVNNTKTNNHSVSVTKTNAVNDDTHTLSSSYASGISTVTLNHKISSYRYATQTKNVSYNYTIKFSNIIGQTLSKTHKCNINIRPQINGLDFKRNIPDIFHHTTYAEDIQMGYDSEHYPYGFVAPKQRYFDKIDNETKYRWSNITVQVSSIVDRDSEDDKLLQIQLKNKPNSDVNFTKDVADTKYTWTQNDDHSGTGDILVRAYDNYNYGYDKDADSHTISLLSSGMPSEPTSVIILPYSRYIEGDETGVITDDDGNKYIPNGLATSTTCGPYVRVLVPLAGSKVPNTLEKHIRIQVNVYQLDVLQYKKISDVSKNTVVYNNVSYHELFFPLNLTNKANSNDDLDTIKFKVCYVDRFDNVSAEYYNNKTYQAYESPIFDVCGTQGGGYRWLFVSPRYFLSSDPYSDNPPITNLINTKWQMNNDAHLVELLSNETNLIDIMDFKTDNASTSNIVYSSASLHEPPKNEHIDDLSNTTWYFNEVLDLSGLPRGTINVNFVSNNTQYTQMARDITGSGFHYYNPTTYSLASVYSYGHWDNSDVYRTITITGGTSVTSSSFIQWLYDNATIIQADNVVKNLTNTRWVLKSNLTLPSSASEFINANINFTSNSHSYELLTISSIIQYGSTLVYENGEWANKYYRVLHITGGEDVTNRQLIDWLSANSTPMYISYNVNDISNVVCFVTTNETLPPSYNYEWLNQNDRKITFIDGENANDSTLINWFTNNASLLQTNIIEEDYLRTPIFYSKVLNPNTIPFYVQPYLYKKTASGITEVTHNVGTIASDGTITAWSKKQIVAGSSNIAKQTLIDFVFLNSNNQKYYFELDTLYYVILKLYMNNTTTTVSEMTTYDKNATYQLSYYYQREDVENAKIWGIDDYTPDNYVQAEQMNVINQYISRVWDSYMIEGDVPLIDLYKNDIIFGEVPSEERVVHNLNYSIPLNPNYYYPEQRDGVPNINLCGPDIESGGTNIWFTKYIPWNGRNEDIQMQIPLQSSSAGKRLTLTVYYYDENLRQIYNTASNSYVFNEIISTPSSSTEGSIPAGNNKFYCNEILSQPIIGSTWYFNDHIDISNDFTYNVNFTSLNTNGTLHSLKQMKVALHGSPSYKKLHYYTSSGSGAYLVYNNTGSNSWDNGTFWRTITLTGGDDIDNANFITWLKNNATMQSSIFGDVKYIRLKMELDSGLTLLHDNTDILYLGGIQNTQRGYDDIVAYKGTSDTRTITVYTDAHGNMSKTAVINNMCVCLEYLRSEIYGVLGSKYNINHLHSLRPFPIYYTDDQTHTSYIVSYNQEITQKYPGVGDIDTLAIDNLPYNSQDGCSVFSAFKDF